MIDVTALTRTYGGLRAVDGVSFTAQPGRVTGFLGPNGAGKSTTMRVMVGLTPPSSGSATVLGRRYADLAAGVGELGVLAAEDGGGPGGRGGQADHHAHGRRLAGAVGAQEAGDPARGGGEGDVVDGAQAAVRPGQVADFDHVPKTPARRGSGTSGTSPERSLAAP